MDSDLEPPEQGRGGIEVGRRLAWGRRGEVQVCW